MVAPRPRQTQLNQGELYPVSGDATWSRFSGARAGAGHRRRAPRFSSRCRAELERLLDTSSGAD
ncbi:MAG: hypothetical protein R3E96_00455 [Planctomycetota bacterium]